MQNRNVYSTWKYSWRTACFRFAGSYMTNIRLTFRCVIPVVLSYNITYELGISENNNVQLILIKPPRNLTMALEAETCSCSDYILQLVALYIVHCSYDGSTLTHIYV
jgi:hypothetical protein